MNKQILFFTLFLLVCSTCCLHAVNTTTKKSEFIIAPAAATKKNRSVNALKEHIGTTTKQLFECTTSVGKQLGQVQCELACLQQDVVDNGSQTASCLKEVLSASAGFNRVLGSIQNKIALLQQKCSSIIEKLIDNHAPFKRATKKNLEQSLAVLTTAHQQLNTCEVTFHRVNDTIKKSGTGLSRRRVRRSLGEVGSLAKTEPTQIVATVQAATKELQAQAALVQQAFTSINTDHCLKNT